MLELYRQALHVRRAEAGFGDGPLHWLAAPAGAIAFSRGDGLACMVNIGAESLPLPKGARLLLASDAVVADALPTDTSAWLRV
jgi:alpha-glucosidase